MSFLVTAHDQYLNRNVDEANSQTSVKRHPN